MHCKLIFPFVIARTQTYYGGFDQKHEVVVIGGGNDFNWAKKKKKKI
jgi:hypothetical protein